MVPKPSISKLVLPADLQNPGYDLFIIVATVLSLFNWVILVIPKLPGPDIKGLVLMMTPLLTVILLSDFAMRLHSSRPNRMRYLNHRGGWLDLLGSLPLAGIFRLFRLIRVTAAFRHFGTRNVMRWFIANRARGTLFLVFSLILIILEFGGLMVLHFESGAPGANIQTGGQALWWGVVTISTVGYGDLYPVTTGGQITATVMIFSGVAVIGIYTAWAASTFTGTGGGTTKGGPTAEITVAPEPAEYPPGPIHDVIHDLRERLDHLESLVKRKGP